MSSGVYAICNKENGKQYIGSSVTIEKRWQRHKTDLRGGIHHSRYLQRAWNKRGEESFDFVVIKHVAPDKILEAEQEMLDKNLGEYNVSPTAANCLGVKHDPEVGRARGEKRRGRKMSEECRRNMSEARKGSGHPQFGKKQSPETIARRVASRIGKPLSEEQKRKISEAQRGEKGHRAILTESQVLEIKDRIIANEKLKDMAKEYGVHKGSLTNIKTGKAWSYLFTDDELRQMKEARYRMTGERNHFFGKKLPSWI